MTLDKIVNRTVNINARASKVWATLTNSDLVMEWLSDTGIQVISDWRVGSPIVFTGIWHGIEFNDKGTILKFETEKVLQYSYWSGLSGLPDSPENYSLIEFRLTPKEDQTILTLVQSNLATETMYRHSNFYWYVTLDTMRKLIEKL